ncbi:uncharacterized protein LOC116612406 [Nematostella vectensis]|uniref:uncharacterized protein LOC116612406 n=1 Tax=Nematostella vectensis TaxID=45351 RepID=UPI00139052BE|nr:uncharacterized protein LOC116612406 [Nematostella vectensis]
MAGNTMGPDPLQETLKLKAVLAKQPARPPEMCCGLIKDPAIERFGWIRENSDQFFKFRPRTVFYSTMVALVVPGVLYWGIKYIQRSKDIKAGRPPRDFL